MKVVLGSNRYPWLGSNRHPLLGSNRYPWLGLHRHPWLGFLSTHRWVFFLFFNTHLRVLRNPSNGCLCNPSHGYLFDPSNGCLFDPSNGCLFNPSNGCLFDPSNGRLFEHPPNPYPPPPLRSTTFTFNLYLIEFGLPRIRETTTITKTRKNTKCLIYHNKLLLYVFFGLLLDFPFFSYVFSNCFSMPMRP